MRASRLLSMLILLQLRGRLTAQALAEEFELSPRSVYRDMDALSAAGVPIYADRGPGGGFSLLDGYRTRLTGLAAPEAEALLLAGLPAAAAALGLAHPAAAARLKLLAALPPEASKGAARIGERFHLDPLDWYRRAEAPAHLPLIAKAIWGERHLSTHYAGWPAAVRRKIDPLGLVLKAGAWYLLARSRGNVRTYKVERMSDPVMLDEGFAYPHGFDLAAHWRAEVERYEKGLRRGEARLRVSPAALSEIKRLGANIAEAVATAQTGLDGWREAAVPIEGADHAARLLLGFGREIEVLAPAALRRRLAELARQVLALYAEAAAPE
jgi:predicted DNA-binding transcriptional regulator YafY